MLLVSLQQKRLCLQVAMETVGAVGDTASADSYRGTHIQRGQVAPIGTIGETASPERGTAGEFDSRERGSRSEEFK